MYIVHVYMCTHMYLCWVRCTGDWLSSSCRAEYRKVQLKEGGVLNTHPQLAVKGVGYDRTLGGLEVDVRLRDHLARNFEVCADLNGSGFTLYMAVLQWLCVLVLPHLSPSLFFSLLLSPSPPSPLPSSVS